MIKELKQLGIVVAFADDVVIIVNKGESQEVLEKARKICKKYGLEVSMEKCMGTHLPN